MVKIRLNYDGFVEARELNQILISTLYKARINVVTLPPADEEAEKKTLIWGSRSEFAIAPEMKTSFVATSSVLFVELVANQLLRSMVVSLVVSEDIFALILLQKDTNLIHDSRFITSHLLHSFLKLSIGNSCEGVHFT